MIGGGRPSLGGAVRLSVNRAKRAAGRLASPAAVLLSALGVCAAGGREAGLEPIPVGTERAALANGLRVAVCARRVSPLVAIDLWVRAGAREERTGEEGSAHFLEHLLFKGTRTRGPGDADIAIENLGATMSAATGPDYAHFYTTVASADVPEALAILADVVCHPTLPDAEVPRERSVILDELARRDADASAVLVERLYQKAFTAHPYRRSPGGTVAAIGVRGRETLAAFYRRTYRPERSTLVFAGDIEPEEALRLSRKTFGDWKIPDGSRRGPPDSETPVLDEPRFDRSGRPAERLPGDPAWVGIAFSGPAARDFRSAAAAQITAALLGESNGSGRFGTEALSGCSITVRYTPRRDPGLFLILGQVPPVEHSVAGGGQKPAWNATDLEAALRKIVEDLRTHPPSAAEWAAAKRRVSGRILFDTETCAGLAREVGYADAVMGDAPETLRARIEQISVAEFQEFLLRTLNPARSIVAWAGERF